MERCALDNEILLIFVKIGFAAGGNHDIELPVSGFCSANSINQSGKSHNIEKKVLLSPWGLQTNHCS